MAEPAPPAKRKSLVSIVGAACAAALCVAVPREESGRTVTAEVAPTGEIAIRHVSGPQYLTAYRDVVGIWTGCDGIAYVKPGAKFTEAQCTAMLQEQLVKHATGVMGCSPGLRPEGHDNQRTAAVLLAYNIGVSAYCRSTVARRFNAGDYRGACDAFLMWNKAGGRVVKGLDNRRRRERDICRKDLPSPVSQPTPAAAQICLPEGPPLRERPKHHYDYRMGGRRFDGGIV